MRVASLHVYPVKSCRGTDLSAVTLGIRGFDNDRMFMVVDSEGRFMTQREYPRMCLIFPRIEGDHLSLEMPGQPSLSLPIRTKGHALSVTVWRDACVGIDQGEEASNWLSQALGTRACLVRMADEHVRHCDPMYAPRSDDQTAFSDGFPVLLISEASLVDLNSRLEQPLPMNRFRPNLVVSGCPAYAEDVWQRIRVDGLEFDVVKPCSRCAITTTDQLTAERAKEPLRTLASYRKRGNDVFFGQNLIHSGTGEIKVGAKVEVLSTRAN